MPGTRLPTYVADGALPEPLAHLIGWIALPYVLCTPLLVVAAMMMGAGAQKILDSRSHAAPALFIAGIAAWLAARDGAALCTCRSRRLLLSRWRRLSRGEFCPM